MLPHCAPVPRRRKPVGRRDRTAAAADQRARGRRPGGGLLRLGGRLGGAHQYARFASHLRGRYGVSALDAPGFAPEQPVPADMTTLLRYQALTIRQQLSGRRLVLVGSSSGGTLAHGPPPSWSG
ncbi:alpha/beta fold hydrolase [Streptacidiphilus sp. 4-A2]|nr:alpha/beta fold hydrolase [Streptacidiphilus sp. 4-A2]